MSFLSLQLSVFLFLAALDLRCCTQAFSSCSEVVLGLLCGASLVVEHRL